MSWLCIFQIWTSDVKLDVEAGVKPRSDIMAVQNWGEQDFKITRISWQANAYLKF